MNKREYAQANKDWLTQKAKEEGVQTLPKGVLYKVLTSGENNGKHGFDCIVPARSAISLQW